MSSLYLDDEQEFLLKNLEVSSKIYKVYPHDSLYTELKREFRNRDVNDTHVIRIKENIKKNNLLHLQPIIVQAREEGSLSIIDGQHRAEAAISLGLPFYILLDDSLEIVNLISLNTYQKNWSLSNFVDFWANNEETSHAYNMYKQCKKENLVSNSVLIAIFNKSSQYVQATWEFKDGKLKYDSFNSDHIKDTLLKIRRVQRCPTNPTLDKNVLDRKPFQLALLEAFENTTFDFEKFLDNLKRSRHKFNILAKKTDYTKEIFRIERKRK